MSEDEAKRKLNLEAALGELPLFPLGEVVLFPNVLLPLHIFEPRYRKMLKDCLASHGAMAIVHVEDETDVDEHGQPRIAKIAGAGCIVGHEAFADGRANIVLRGIARVEIEELPFVEPYRRARARILRDDDMNVAEPEKMALLSTASAFAAAVRKHDASFTFEIPPSLTAQELADLCAHHLMVDPKARQAVLEERDPTERVRIVTSELLVQQKTLFGTGSGVLH